eukprot:TRINITY_DN376_c0_g1_i1.p1 TRINITY_DN376_c0_g1~~TRINITY_DN376_c0_g1_i1.p1  ORF type:complete len:888 (+),score=171.53 TRINITY_DN376_c0_g1_i1:42-2666(+)
MQPNPYQPPNDMTSEQRALIERENEARRLFAEEPNSPELSDPHLLMVNVFDNFDSFVYSEETPEEKKVPKLLTHYRRLDLKGKAIVPKATFLSNWSEFTQGCLDGLDWNNVFVAGGAVLGCLNAEQDGYRSSDIDLFVHGITDEAEANEKLKSIYNTVINNTRGKGDVIRTKRAITILCTYPYRHVQVILRLYKSPAEVLLGFDIDSCCVGFDGTDVWCQERFKRALTKRYNLVNTSRRSLTYESRLFKYSKRGFAVAVPKLDKSRVDIRLFSKDFREVAGLAKLVLYDFKQGSKSSTFAKPRARARAIPEEGSDYNNDLPIPWGPGWNTDVIMNLLQNKNRAKFFASVRKNKDDSAPTDDQSKKDKAYNHMFTNNAAGLLAGDFETWKRSLDSKEVKHPLEWIKDNPAYQDFDNGFKRLMTGSFEPVVDENWENSVYLPGGQVAPPYVLSEKYLSTDDSSIADSKNSPGKGQAALSFQPSPAKAARPSFFGAAPPSFGVPAKPRTFGGASTYLGPASSSVGGAGASAFTAGSGTYDPSVSAASFGGPSASGATTSTSTAPTSIFGGTFSNTPAPSFGAGATFAAGSGTYDPSVSAASFGGPSAAAASYSSMSIGGSTSASVFGTTAPIASTSTASTSIFGGTYDPSVSAASFGGPSASYSPTNTGEAVSAGFYSFDNNAVRRSLEEARKTSPKKKAAKTTLFGPQPGNFGVSDIPTTPSRQHTFDTGLAPPQSPSLKAFSTFGDSPSVSQPFSDPEQFQTQPFQTQPFQTLPLPTLPALDPLYNNYPSLPSATPTVVRVGGVSPTPATSTTKLLLLIALLSKKGLISTEEKGKLKDLTLAKDELINSALEVFEIDQDLNELADTLRRICKASR